MLRIYFQTKIVVNTERIIGINIFLRSKQSKSLGFGSVQGFMFCIMVK